MARTFVIYHLHEQFLKGKPRKLGLTRPLYSSEDDARVVEILIHLTIYMLTCKRILGLCDPCGFGIKYKDIVCRLTLVSGHTLPCTKQKYQTKKK